MSDRPGHEFDNPACCQHGIRITTVERDVEYMKDAFNEMRETQKEIGDSLKQLTLIAERQIEQSEALGRAFKAIEKLEGTVDEIKLLMPGLKELRWFVVKALIGFLSLSGIAAFAAFVKSIH